MGAIRLRYAGGRLDRTSRHRADPDWIRDQLQQPATRFVPLWRGRHLVRGSDERLPEALLPARPEAQRLIDASTGQTFLGLENAVALFALDLSPLEEPEVRELFHDGRYADLRHVGPWVPPHEASLLAYARGMIEWQRRHRHCGCCGAPAETDRGGHVQRCTNSRCGEQIFPRTDPAVIMLVDHCPSHGPPACLLGHHERLPAGTYSTLAGFVEPGESLEEAVAREVAEETGVRVRDVVYVASQPWPFPGSLMVGFRARAIDRHVTLDRDELDDAGWFTAAQLRQFGEWADETARYRLPRRDSIARFLIESWMADVDPPVDAD
jgi:NAD+ diphosphatase